MLFLDLRYITNCQIDLPTVILFYCVMKIFETFGVGDTKRRESTHSYVNGFSTTVNATEGEEKWNKRISVLKVLNFTT